MTQTPDDLPASDASQHDAEPTPEPALDAKRGVNDPDPAGTGTDEPLTSL